MHNTNWFFDEHTDLEAAFRTIDGLIAGNQVEAGVELMEQALEFVSDRHRPEEFSHYLSPEIREYWEDLAAFHRFAHR